MTRLLPQPTFSSVAAPERAERLSAPDWQCAPANLSDRITTVLFEKTSGLFGSIAIVESNIQSVRACELFSRGQSPFVAVIGPSGVGKSTLLRTAAKRLIGADPVSVQDASTWGTGRPRREKGEPLVLDNLQDAAAQAKIRQNLRIGLERRVKMKRPTLVSITSNLPVEFARAILPSSKDWLVTHIQKPTFEDRKVIIRQLFEFHSLPASRSLVQLMAKQDHWSGPTYIGILSRLQLAKRDWSLESDALAGCGVFNPFLSDESGWDLREAIARVTHERRGRIPRNRAKDLALYLMLHVAGLSEASVSQFYNIAPAEAFRRAAAFAKTLPQTEVEQAAVTRISREIIDFLLQE